MTRDRDGGGDRGQTELVCELLLLLLLRCGTDHIITQPQQRG